ncbi:sensor histidine kinase [Actinomadura sp. 21ATH]|uniref:sensor histidine kinase n=1 Tax=Actinomadura sp. 21ATH TaxID=1735444 RepID=UPI0035C16F34
MRVRDSARLPWASAVPLPGAPAAAGERLPGDAVLAVALAGLCLVLIVLLGAGIRAYRSAAARARRRRGEIRALAAEAAEAAAVGPLGSARVAVPGDDDLALLARTFNATLDRLERLFDQQRQFAADASHELRTPVTGLRTRLEVALADPDGTDLVGTLRDAMGDAERLQRIVTDLLALTRIDAGSAPVAMPLDLTGLVRAELSGRSDRVPVRSRLEEGVAVRVNRLQMCRVLVSLLSNAERYAREGIEVCLAADAGEAVLEVRDDGPGIASGDRERIFERFARVDSARSRAAGGSGLGLAVAREIVMAHGGRLYVGPSERGARLILRLPLHRDGDGPAAGDLAVDGAALDGSAACGAGEAAVPGRPERGVLRPPVPAASRTERE